MGTFPKIKERPFDQRPYEKFASYGPESLSDSELLAIILKTGVAGMSAIEIADKVLNLCPYEQGFCGIYHLSTDELKKLPGIGEVKAMQIKCIGEISKRISQRSAKKRLYARDPSTIADYYMETLSHEEQEHVYCMMLDTKNAVTADVFISKGTVDSSLVSVREIFIKAFEYHAVGLILVHNHPSGDPTASREDIEITRRIKAAGEMLGITLVDHIIIGNNDYYSIFEHNSFS